MARNQSAEGDATDVVAVLAMLLFVLGAFTLVVAAVLATFDAYGLWGVGAFFTGSGVALLIAVAVAEVVR